MSVVVSFLVVQYFFLAQGGWWPTRESIERLAIQSMGFDASATCGYTRTDALHCIARYVDTNHDKEVSRSEFEYAKNNYLPPIAAKVHWVAHKLGMDATYEDALRGCDTDHDGRLTLSDWMYGAKNCLPGKRDLCMFKTVCDVAERKEAVRVHK